MPRHILATIDALARVRIEEFLHILGSYKLILAVRDEILTATFADAGNGICRFDESQSALWWALRHRSLA